jgi:hypothetical protein
MSRGSVAWMKETWGLACRPDLVVIPIYGGGPKFQCDRRARDAFLQLGAIFVRWGYIIHDVGCYNCRANTSDPSIPSNHSWGTALDVNAASNPYRRDRLITDMPDGMIKEIRALKTKGGVTVFRWGGDYRSVKDAMHFEIMATPEELAEGFWAVILSDEPVGHPVLRRGAHGPAVVELQTALKLARTSGNGQFGPRTEEAVRRYQQAHGLVADGIVGRATWTALLTKQPSLASGAPSPIKLVA